MDSGVSSDDNPCRTFLLCLAYPRGNAIKFVFSREGELLLEADFVCKNENAVGTTSKMKQMSKKLIGVAKIEHIIYPV